MGSRLGRDSHHKKAEAKRMWIEWVGGVLLVERLERIVSCFKKKRERNNGLLSAMCRGRGIGNHGFEEGEHGK